MRLDFNYDFTSVRYFLEDLGSLRLSAFYSTEKSSLGEIVQKVARFVLGLFVGLCAYDCVACSLPGKVRMIVRGTLCLLASCVGLSVLLKSVAIYSTKETVPPPVVNISEQKDESVAFDLEIDAEEETKPEEVVKEETPFKHVRRNLLSEFDKAAQEAG